MVWKLREGIGAGAYNQRIGTVASSFTGLSVSSNFAGHAQIRGIATINSGTTVVSIAAVGVVSGNAILTAIIQYASVQTLPGTIGMIPVTCARSVRTGAFEIVTVGSYAPLGDMPVAWFKIA